MYLNSADIVDMTEAINEVQKKLKGYEDRVPTVLAKILNDTAAKARTDLTRQAQKIYAVKDAGFEKGIKIKAATKNKAYAVLNVSGKPLDLIKFKTTPARYNPKSRPDYGVKANVLKSSTPEVLIKPSNDAKAFIVKYSNGHIAVAQRKNKYQKVDRTHQKLRKAMNTAAKKMGIKKKDPNRAIVSLYGPSVPQMLGNVDKVYGVVKPDLQRYLLESTQKKIIEELRYQKFRNSKK